MPYKSRKKMGAAIDKALSKRTDLPDKPGGARKSFAPPAEVRSAARRALALREKLPESRRGMTEVGIARARDLANGRPVTVETMRRMNSFFARHEVDKKGEGWGKDSKGYQAWLGWGGDPGWSWVKSTLAKHDKK